MVYTVTQINTQIQEMLEGYMPFHNVFIRGEISNYKLHTSGHHYMTLKDENSVISAVFFRHQAQKLRIRLKNGMRIIARGRIGVFPKSGQYQLYISDLMPDGVGDLHVAFEQCKRKLYEEGLFDPALKKELPLYPGTIALVTSPTGAAVRDMLRILKRRYPLAAVRIYPVLVQGEGAAESICEAINFINNENRVDLMIVGRGGGSLEDLWAFNEEIVARTIFASNIPVISAVGHEPDVTIADFAADVRAATPSNGAELAVPDQISVWQDLRQMQAGMTAAMQRRLQEQNNRLALCSSRLAGKNPARQLDEKRLQLDFLTEKLQHQMHKQLEQCKQRLGASLTKMEALNPLHVLARGYAIVENQKGQALRCAADVQIGENIWIRLQQGSLQAQITEIQEGEKADGKDYEES
jgi:exodeoxyribonuclease VII large subunit